MNQRPAFISVALAFGLLGAATPAQQPAPPTPDSLVDLNKGIELYLRAVGASASPKAAGEDYRAALDLFSSVLQREPANPAALLFHSLCHGGLALVERYVRVVELQDIADADDEVLKARGSPEVLERIRGEVEALRTTAQDASLEPAERLIAELTLKQRESFLRRCEEEKRSDDELRGSIAEKRAQVRARSEAERGHYVAMSTDLTALLRVLDKPEVVVRLMEVLARSKVASSDEDEALRVRRGELEESQARAPVDALRADAAEALRQVANILQELIRGGFASREDEVRTKFFLGVVRYRQAVPRRADTEVPELDETLLAQAEKIMAEAQRIMQDLADDPNIEKTWRSYASFYLGLIITSRASRESDLGRRQAVLREAESRLAEAARYDLNPAAKPDAPPEVRSRSEGRLPELVAKQRVLIARLAEPQVGAVQLRNDLQLTLFTGAHRDTNVVLLGERTDLPRDISRTRDFGFTAGLIVDYTRDLSEKLTLGFQGRVSQLWHADVDEFDEQQYGASVALQYELVPEGESFGPMHLRLQYDYDYTLLGRAAFVETQSLTPNLRFFWDQRRAETNVYFAVTLRDYREPLFDRRFDRDGEYFALGILQSYKLLDMTPRYENAGIEPWGAKGDAYLRQDDPDFPARFLTPYLGFQYAWDSTNGDEFDQNEFTFLCGVTVPLPLGVDLDANAGFEWQDYRHGSLIDYHRRARRDFTQRYTLALSRTFVLRGGAPANRYRLDIDRLLMTVRAHATWTLDDSNVVNRLGEAIFEYDRVLYGISVSFAFN
ncbi:MAG: hypothetical protein HY763_11950 [Planctomycetes bacterium]|nr:hypothetical protein [Planctomycetota bacterium]